MHPNYTIRKASPQDAQELARLIKAHAAYEKSYLQIEGLSNRLEHELANSNSNLQCLLLIYEKAPVGFVTFMPQFSTWDVSNYVYLDCLYLEESARGKGLGQDLMQHVKTYTQSNGYSQIQWQTPDFNKDAIRFYKRLGALPKTKERFFWEI